ncbi:hypothetical protein HMPREF1485_01051 [Propionibacterium sp. HGH0353]|nr:hypothetical protein HMPREF1485_01051 [Propionibacterium sp. HGH0353]
MSQFRCCIAGYGVAPAWYFRAEGEVVEAGSDLRSMAVLVGLGPVRTVEDEESVADRHGLDGGRGSPLLIASVILRSLVGSVCSCHTSSRVGMLSVVIVCDLSVRCGISHGIDH